LVIEKEAGDEFASSPFTNMKSLRFIASTWKPTTSWGRVARGLAKYLEPPVDYRGIRDEPPQDLPKLDEIDLQLFWGAPFDLRVLGHIDVLFTTWETTRCPFDSKFYTPRPGQIWATSAFAAKSLYADKIVRLGALPLPSAEKNITNDFIFGSIGNFSQRKGFDLIIRAFLHSFENKNAHLWLKSNKPVPRWVPSHPQIKIITEELSEEQLSQFYMNIDYYIQASRGEGFGLCPLEAASLGIPSIVTDGSALSELIDDKMIFGVHTEPRKSVMGGTWFEADIEDLEKKMLMAYQGEIGFHSLNNVRTIEDTAHDIRRLTEEI